MSSTLNGQVAERIVALAAELGISLTQWQIRLIRELYTVVGPDGRFKHHQLTDQHIRRRWP